jgi:metal-responsive CopG/Arc/MetJ family transcriptional regulator
LVKTSRRLRRILIHVPTEFLEEFDKETRGLYASRNEAIRAGMMLVLETLKKRSVVEDQCPF